MPVADLDEALAVHIGSGVVQIHADHPDYDAVKYFEVVTSDSLTGDYFDISNNRFSGPDGFIYGFIPGRTIYMKIRAIGVDNSVSSWAQIKLGKVSTGNIVMQCRGVQGSSIPAGSTFTHAKASRLFGIRSLSQINFPVET